MPVLTSTPVTWNWSAKVDQDTNPRFVQTADLVKLINCVRNKQGQLLARAGNDKTDYDEFIGATYAEPAVCIEASETHLIFRDSADQIWCLDPATGKAQYRGLHLRAQPSVYQLQDISNDGGSRKPVLVQKGTELWRLDLGVTTSSVKGYQLTVVSTSGVVVRETFATNAANIAAYAACLDSAGKVCLAYVNATNGAIVLHKWADSADASPTITTWDTVAGVVLHQIDIAAHGTNLIVVAQGSKDDAGDRVSTIYRSLGAAAGGAATASSTTVSTCTGGAGTESSSGLSIFTDEDDFASGFYTIGFFQTKAADATKAEVVRQTVSVTVPSTVTQTILGESALSDASAMGVVTGYIEQGTDIPVTFATFQDCFSSDFSMIQPNGQRIRRWHGTTGTTISYSTGVASKPWYAKGAWWVLGMFSDWDDDGSGGRALQNVGIQNSYYVLRASDGVVATPVLDGDTQCVPFFGSLNAFGSYIGSLSAGHVVTPVVIDDNNVVLPLLSQGAVITNPGRIMATVDHDPAGQYSTAPGVITGGVNVTVGPLDSVSEVSPLQGPYSHYTIMSSTAGSYTGMNFINFLYAIRQSDGSAKLSAPFNLGPAPSPESFAVHGTSVLRLPTLRHTAGGQIEIWIYGSAPDELPMYLQDRRAQPDGVDYVDVTIIPANWKAGLSEPLPTTGNSLPFVPPLSAKVAWQQGARTMLAGTPEHDVWQSFERSPGLTASWHPGLNFKLPEGASEITAGIELDANSSAIFTADGVYISQGNPDGHASGGTIVTTVTRGKGCSNPASVTKGPLGIYFANAADGRMQLLTGGAVIDIAAGMIESNGKTWVSAHDCPDEGLIRWQASDGSRLTLQYRYLPQDGSAPYGTWVPETSTAFPEAVGARLISGVHTMVQGGDETASISTWTPGDNYYDGTSATPVLINFKTGKLSPAGYMNAFDTDWHVFSTTHLGGDCTYDVTVTCDGTGGTSEVHEVDASTTPDFAFRASVFRARDFSIEVQQTSATGAGHVWDGVSVEIKTDGKIRRPALSRWLA